MQLLPSSVPVLKIESDFDSHFASIDLLVKSFYLVEAIGRMQGIDPGRPGVPDFGRKLYHLRYKSALKKADIKEELRIALQRKLSPRSIYTLSSEELQEWKTAYHEYKSNIESKTYGAVIFDYDGTLCGTTERQTGININVSNALNRILAKGITVGIATGRGKSARTDLQGKIKKQYHKNVIIGYYNGADVGLLNDDEIPHRDTKDESQELKEVELQLLHHFGKSLNIQVRAKQLTIEFSKENYFIKDQIREFITSKRFEGVAFVESSHSMDIIIKPHVSKLNVIASCMNHLQSSGGKHQEILCIGDKGRFPGNDYELLGHSNSLSVDEVSTDKMSCWNFGLPSTRQVLATLNYLNKFELHNKSFTISL
ncbi:HAD family hydrolase [Niabella hibiscisoli]|uniref:HAD family hydrolase n=1 Tax=Niabella hibiscisoli TaxID=1825928 RepID=UPI001F105CB6|nr:HAD-IIB family hydrolase [Niabella hibiscisoli]MCH5717778.1 HAD-IIB family hydrolase [Niabella hibiscisoli]